MTPLVYKDWSTDRLIEKPMTTQTVRTTGAQLSPGIGHLGEGNTRLGDRHLSDGPEPGTLSLFALGLAVIGAAFGRKKVA